MVYVHIDGEGYARADIRMNEKGELFMLELNPNCSIFYPDDDGSTADVILMLDGFGKSISLHSYPSVCQCSNNGYNR